MRRKWSLIAAGVLVLCVVGIMPLMAQGPDQNPIYATIDYVDERISDLTGYVDQKVAELYVYVDERIAEIGGGAGEDFELPGEEYWTGTAYTCGGVNRLALSTEYDPDNPEKSCSWNGVQLTHPVWGGAPRVDARAVAKYGEETAGYGVGCCKDMTFLGLSRLPEAGEIIDVEIWLFWMGTTKQTHLEVVCGPRVWVDDCEVMQCTAVYAP